MENISQFPLCVHGFTTFSPLNLDQAVFFPGNDRHGVWSSPYLETVYAEPVTDRRNPPRAKPPTLPAAQPAAPRTAVAPQPAAPQQKSVAGRPGAGPRNYSTTIDGGLRAA